MINRKDYIIIAVVCLCVIAAIVGIAIVGARSTDAKNESMEVVETVPVTEPIEEEVVIEETVPETTEVTEPVTEPVEEVTEPPLVEEEEEEYYNYTYYEPPVQSATPPVVEEPAPQPEPAEPPVEEGTTTIIDPDELEMLACVIYQEAGGDECCDECRYRVADVVLNRVEDERFPDTMEEVLTAPHQYGKYSWTGIVWPDRANNSGEAHAVERAYDIAEDVLSGNHSELYGNDYVWQAGFVQGDENVYCCGHYYGK